MITFLIPSISNPKGLANVLASIRKDVFVKDTEVIVLLETTDIHREESVLVCQSPALHPMKVRMHTYDSPSLTARINHASMCCHTPLICVLNDDIILESAKGKVETLITEAVKECLDSILVLYLCRKDIGDNHYSYPIVTKRVVELLGYFYHPICACREICERWLGSMFHDLNRMLPITGVTVLRSTDNPTQVHVNDEVVQSANSLYSETGNVRRGTAESLKKFML
jgi:hypothetical protein